MTTTLAYRGRRVAFLGWSDTEGHPLTDADDALGTHAWIAHGDTHADGIGFTETGNAFLVDADELRNPFPYDGCEACGWQYPEAVMVAYSHGLATIDENPTHLCNPATRYHTAALAASMQRHPAGKGIHQRACRAEAVLCAVENTRDSAEYQPLVTQAMERVIAEGDGYLADGSCTCHCV